MGSVKFGGRGGATVGPFARVKGGSSRTIPPPPSAIGGLLLNSKASVSVRRSLSGYGGLVLNSLAVTRARHAFSGYGGLVLDGQAVQKHRLVFPGYGGLVLNNACTFHASAWNPFRTTLSLEVNGGVDDSATLTRTAFDHWEGTSLTTAITYVVDGGYPFGGQVLNANDATHGPDVETFVSFDQPTKTATWSWSSAWGFTVGAVVSVTL